MAKCWQECWQSANAVSLTRQEILALKNKKVWQKIELYKYPIF